MIHRLPFYIALYAAMLALPLTAVSTAEARAASDIVIAAALGDLGPFRSIAEDTLKIVGTGDLPAAKVRIRDLETSWDKAEATLKPRDKANWTLIDKAIDEALVALRTPGSKAEECSATLKALIAKMDAVQKSA